MKLSLEIFLLQSWKYGTALVFVNIFREVEKKSKNIVFHGVILKVTLVGMTLQLISFDSYIQ